MVYKLGFRYVIVFNVMVYNIGFNIRVHNIVFMILHI